VKVKGERVPVPAPPTSAPPLAQRRRPAEAASKPRTAPSVSGHPETLSVLLEDIGRRRIGVPSGGEAPLNWDELPTVRAPLGRLFGARSGDKGGNANIGVWARDDEAYDWLSWYLTESRLRALMPEETRGLDVQRFELPNLRALNFVIVGLLGRGVAASTRTDPQAKGLGEYLRAKHVDLPESLLAARASEGDRP
jgi:hypothetical protein